jgi:hypothetical protein
MCRDFAGAGVDQRPGGRIDVQESAHRRSAALESDGAFKPAPDGI